MGTLITGGARRVGPALARALDDAACAPSLAGFDLAVAAPDAVVIEPDFARDPWGALDETRAALDALRAAAPKVIVLVSTAEVYGP
ncbi:MAG: hypothetical protein R3A52_32355, partial [Polyangiales bacterium]